MNNPDTAFAWASQAAATGWVCLLAGMALQGLAPRHAGAARWAHGCLWVGGRLLPVLLCAGYALALARWIGTANGGFGSLDDVARLFQTRGLRLAAMPGLLMTFLLGPVGLLLFLLLMGLHARGAPAPNRTA